MASAVGSHTLAVAIQALGGMAASMAIAWLSYEFFEKYFLQLKHLWPSSPEARDSPSSESVPEQVGAAFSVGEPPSAAGCR